MEYIQPSHFNQSERPAEASQLSPSEEFRAAHPDYVEPSTKISEWDPNARRAAQLEGVGGGLSQGLRGEFQNNSAETSDGQEIETTNEESAKEKAMQATREMVQRAHERAAAEGRIIPTAEEAGVKSRRAATNFLNSRR